MREPYGEGPASHTGPESCVRDGSVPCEALTGEDAGQKPQAASFKLQAASHERRAPSQRGKLQASSCEPRAASAETQATSCKLQAASRKPEAAGHERRARAGQPHASSYKPQVPGRLRSSAFICGSILLPPRLCGLCVRHLAFPIADCRLPIAD